MRSSSDIGPPTLTLPWRNPGLPGFRTMLRKSGKPDLRQGRERRGRAAGKFFSEIGLDHPLISCDLARIAVCDQLAVMKDEHALGQRKDHLHHMLDDQDRDAAPGDAADERQRAVDLARIEAEF